MVCLVGLLAAGLFPFATVSAQPLDQQEQEAKSQVASLEAKLDAAVEKYNFACSKLEETKARIDENEAELEEAEAQLAKNKDRLNSRVRAMYVGGRTRFIDVVVNSDDFDQFLTGVDLAKKISSKDASLVKDVKDAKAKLDNVKEELAAQKEAEAAAMAEMEDIKDSVSNELSGAKGNLAGIEEQIR